MPLGYPTKRTPFLKTADCSTFPGARASRPLFLASRREFPAYFLSFVLITFSATAQVQQAWVARYNNDITNGTNQAVKMALDGAGNIYVTGFSQNTNTNLGYVTIKYAPNGNRLWSARFDSTNYPTATPSGLALDSSNNVVVTGSALTIKYDTNGNQLWTAPFDGTALAVDASGNAFVTGWESAFYTAKIGPTGSNIWLRSYVSPYGPALSQAIVVDASGDAYVAGWDTFICYTYAGFVDCYSGLLTLKYDQNGNQVWINVPTSGRSTQVAGMALGTSNVYVIENDYLNPWSTFCYTMDGTAVWQSDPLFNMTALGGLVLDSLGRTTVSGSAVPAPGNYPNTCYSTVRVDTNGTPLWTNYYPLSPTMAGAADAIGTDKSGNTYVTGYSPAASGTNSIVTIKYKPDGSQVWLQSYNGLNAGNDAGTAIAIDQNGNVYVTGYETLPGGGTGIVTIKYAPISIQRQTNGTVLIEAQGSPGEMFDIEASTNLQTWLDLGTVTADTNGLIQFDDTNAPNLPARFYYTNPQ
jgi:hypothetical protein